MADDPLDHLARLNAEAFQNPYDDTDERLELGSDVELAKALSRNLEAEHGQVVFAEGNFWWFEETCWVPVENSRLRRVVHEFDGAPCGAEPKRQLVKLNKTRINSIIHELAAMRSEPGFFDNPDAGINCLSGFMRIGGNDIIEIEPSSPDHRCRHTIPVAWDANVIENSYQNSLLKRFLNGLFKGDDDTAEKIAVVEELLGVSALGSGTRIANPKAIIFVGPKAQNGKSQTLDLIRAMLPGDAVSAIAPAQFSDERHLVGLIGKHLNACDELSSGKAIESDRFKAVITGDPITGRNLYRSAETFRSQALNIFATNALPSFQGGFDRGVRRRLLVINFNRVIPETERVERIAKKIAQDEPELLLAIAILGASRVLETGAFTQPRSGKEALNDWLVGSDPVVAWLEAGELANLLVRDGKVRTREAHRMFKEWSIAEGFSEHRTVSINRFTQRVSACADDVEHRRQSDGSYFFDRKRLL